MIINSYKLKMSSKNFSIPTAKTFIKISKMKKIENAKFNFTFNKNILNDVKNHKHKEIKY